jgi:alpha-1,2-mannosyltransferase
MQTRSLLPLAAWAGIFGLYGWAVFAFAFRYDGVIGPRYNAPGTDYMVYWGAAQSALDGRMALIYDGAGFTQFLNERFADWISGPLTFHPFVYPPHFLLLLIPFGLLPFGLSYAVFIGLTAMALAGAVACIVRARDERLIIGAALLLSPAASVTAITGQNAFLTVALLVAGVALAERRPVVAGLLLAVLSCKPQFWPMAPLALAAAGQWRAFAAMTAGLLALALASVFAFGLAPWQAWLGELLAPPASFQDQWRQWSVLWGDDVFACASLLGASGTLAWTAQLAAGLGAAACVIRCFMRYSAHPLRFPLLLAAAAFAAPHLQGYDTMLLATAALLFLAHGMEHGLHPGDAALALALWVVPIFGPPRVIPIGFLIPPLECWFLVVLMLRMNAFRSADVALGTPT